MKKIVLLLVAIMMVSINSVSMASNKGKHHHKGNHTEVIVRYDNDRDHNYRNYRDRDYRDGDRYIRHDNRRYDNYSDHRYCERKHRKDRYYECRHNRHHHNSDAKVAGAILGTAALVLLTSH
jgi:Ni/Co efflux regulator RcnB